MGRCLDDAMGLFDDTPPSIAARHYSKAAADPEVITSVLILTLETLTLALIITALDSTQHTCPSSAAQQGSCGP